MNRRNFFQIGLGSAAFFSLRRRASAFYQSPQLKKFIQPLRGAGPGGIPVAVPDVARAPVTGAAHYTLDVAQFTDQLHPALGPTTLRGFVPTRSLGTNAPSQAHLGGIIIAKKGTPVQITFRNNLAGPHPLPVDASIMGALGQTDNRLSIHLHGGFVPWISDGGPFAWFDPAGGHGPSFLNNQVLNPHAAPNAAEYYYPNDQTARMMWYHDHAMGITRLNAYAGIASAYIVRDAFEGAMRNFGLPDFVENGGREIPIVIQDKTFVGADIHSVDPTWPCSDAPGSLWYPHQYDGSRWDHETGKPNPADPSVVPEFFGDTMLANGTVYPEATVEARRYRLRVLNACNARFLNLQLYVEDGSPDGITMNSFCHPVNDPGPNFLQIGTEGGFLLAPATIPSNKPFNRLTQRGSLIMAPAERADLIIDFKGFEGKNLILYNDAPAPFPDGEPDYDYFPGSPGNPTQPTPGFGPNTRQIMRFNVVPATGRPDPPSQLKNFPIGLGNSVFVNFLDLQAYKKFTIRHLTLNEGSDESGRLIQLLGTNQMTGGGFSRAYTDPATETPRGGSIEVWQIANLTGDTHPIHFHLQGVQILFRQPFNPDLYSGKPIYTGPARGPDPNELGWKETVRMNPGEVTTVAIKFDLPQVPFRIPSSPRTGGHEYVWHCHILEHEEHDMMRPLIVT